MKIRRGESGDSGKIEVQMAPMIDVVFQLLIFFMLTLKIIQPEGHFDINMPIGFSDQQPEITPQDIKVRLTANEDGSLQQVYFGANPLGSDSPACFQRLNDQIAGVVGGAGHMADDVVVEIDAAYNLDYQYTVKAVSSCLGRIDPVTRRPVHFVSNIKFKPPERPEGI
jgi:biopolymer transport protein ExbD